MKIHIFGWLLGLGILLLAGDRLRSRLQLSRAKHRGLAGHPRMARLLARLVPFYQYDQAQFFRADDAPEPIGEQRRAAFERLAEIYARRFANTVSETREVQAEISDLQFTTRYRVPFQFSRMVRQHLNAGSFVASSSGPTITDLDGNQRYDLTGSYGLNVFGYDFYKQCIARGAEQVRDLGPVLGAYHPVVADNVHRLRAHLRARRSFLPHVRHRGSDAGRAPGTLSHPAPLPGALLRRLPWLVGRRAARGWQSAKRRATPNPRPEMSRQTLRVLRSRHDIACVLVNPLQALHPNAARQPIRPGG